MTYPPADTKRAWYQDNYPGAAIDPNVGVIHTTEGTSLPSYSGGATAPNYTAVPNMKDQRLEWFAHFPDDRSSRALRNDPGGVETNTSNALQVELVGTCDKPTHTKWGNTPHIYWPEAPAWALEDLAEFVAWAHRVHGIPLVAPKFIGYPASYGQSSVRFTGTKWNKFTGWVGHQHVPENLHGDPGALKMPEVLAMAEALLAPAPEPEDDWAPLAISLKSIRAAFTAFLDGTPRGRNVSVYRLQVALGVKPTGVVNPGTVRAWAAHEGADGTGRWKVPDAKSLGRLVRPRFTMEK